MADPNKLIPDQEKFKNDKEDENLNGINLFVNESHVKHDDYSAILKIIQSTRIEKKYYSIKKDNKEHLIEEKKIDIKNFVAHFEKVMMVVEFKGSDFFNLIDEYISNNSISVFIYNYLIIKETIDYKILSTRIESILSYDANFSRNATLISACKIDVKNTPDVKIDDHHNKAIISNEIFTGSINEELKKILKIAPDINGIKDSLNNIFKILVKIDTSILNSKKEQEKCLDELIPELVEQLTTQISVIVDPFKNEVSGISKILAQIPPIPTQDEQPKSIISKFKNNSSLVLQVLTLFFIVTISLILFLSDILKPSVSETKVDSSKIVSDLNANFSNSLKPITTSINNLDNKIKVLGTKDPQIKQLDKEEIAKIKTEVDTVVKEFFIDKKLIIDSDKMQMLVTKIEDLNKGAAPKEDGKGKGEEKKGKDNQPKGTPPSHKVTAEDKKDIAKITSEAIKSIIEQEIRKISSNNDKSKDKTSELASKVTEFNELQVKQVQLKAELDSQKKLVGEKDKILLEFNKVKDGFKGYQGSFAILFTNSKDFPLNENILSTCFTVIEKQPKNQNIGVYIATGNKIAVNLDLRDKKEKLLSLISPIGSPTETLGDAGQDFLDRAFEGEKPPIPVPDRKVIIVATWSAEAPKSNSSGWKDISQVDAILIQPANVQQIRYAKSWFDFVNQKNGRLLLISGPDNFDAGSDNLKQLSKQISTLLNTKKD